jgi:hypothetical protein
MKLAKVLILAFLLNAVAGSLIGQKAKAQELPYTEGTIWSLIFLRIKPGMLDVYLKDIAPQRKMLIEEGRKQGLILSSRILYGEAATRDDWDFVFIDEYKDWAALDGLAAKFEVLLSRIIGPDQTRTQLFLKRGEMREIIGRKTLQELLLK